MFVFSFFKPLVWAWRCCNGYFTENIVGVVKLFPEFKPRIIRFETVDDKDVLFMCNTTVLLPNMYVKIYDSEVICDEPSPLDVIKTIGTGSLDAVYMYKPIPKSCKSASMIVGTLNEDGSTNSVLVEKIFKAEELTNDAFVRQIKSVMSP